MLFDLPLAELRDYRPQLDEPADFDQFWADTLEATRAYPLAASFEPVADSLLRTVDVFDTSFAGFGGDRIAAWLLLPKHRGGVPLPCVVQYIGYGGGRGLHHEWLDWSAFGYAHLIMDTRGQGSTWRSGDTRDAGAGLAGPHSPGFLTLGLPERDDYYYRRVYADAVRAVEAAQSHPDVDARRVIVTGGSQGGGISIAAATLADNVVAAMPDVPFLSHFRRAVDLADQEPYGELLRWCRVHVDLAEQAFAALSYFDVAILGRRSSVPALFSVGMHDPICPPSTVYAAYNSYGEGAGSPVSKDIRVWPYHEHEGGEARQREEQARWLRTIL
ncbi:MAG: acetylxylan esterase [Actinomycetota bacterium]